MKKTICFALLIFIVVCCKSQQTQKLSLELSGGLSLPVGTFASKAQNYTYFSYYSSSNASGLAQAGYSFQATIYYALKKPFGFCVTFKDQQNHQGAKAFEANIRQLLASSDDYDVSTRNWSLLGFLAGGYARFSTHSKKIIFQPRALLGVSKTAIPAFNFLDVTTNASGAQRNSISLPILLSFQVCASVQYNLSKKIFASSSLDYFHAFGKKGSKTIYYDSINYDMTTRVPVSTINFLFGIGYRF